MASEKFPQNVQLDDKIYSVVDVKRGGMGRVWLLVDSFPRDTYDPIHRLRLAVKTFDFTPRHFAIEQELNCWVGLDHENILPLKRIGRLNYRLAAVMPCLLGTIEEDLDKRSVFSEEIVVTIALQTILALRYAYSNHKIVHLDLKPANILIRERNPLRIQISDWGISRIASSIAQSNWQKSESPAQLTSYGAGTPLYMAPERFSGTWEISPRADIYSLGIVLLQLLTGALPFDVAHANPFEEILSGSYVKRASAMLRNSSSTLASLILACINPDERSRPASYDDLILALTRV